VLIVPTQQVYLKDEQYAYLNQLVDRKDDVENLSQAVQWAVDRTRERNDG